MPYKTVLVHVDNGKRAAMRLDIACRLAKLSDAHLIGLHALTVIRLPSYAMVEGGVQVPEDRHEGRPGPGTVHRLARVRHLPVRCRRQPRDEVRGPPPAGPRWPRRPAPALRCGCP